MTAAPVEILSSARWKLDAVGFLAVLGERNIRLSANLITSTALCYLPRLLPAPQGLLSITGDRIKRLPVEENVSVCAVYSGNRLETLNYFASLLHHEFLQGPGLVAQRIEINPKEHDYSDLEVRRRPFGPINLITILSCVGAFVFLVYAASITDWTGFSAVLIMSITSTMISAAYHWVPRLPKRNAPRREEALPPGDLVIRSRQKGSFLVVHCPEAVARKLYFNQEDCVYTLSEHMSRTIGGLAGGILLISAVVLFWNCSWQVQWGAAIAYASLNVAYWLATICPISWTWNFEDFTVLRSDPISHPNYTAALAATIKLVGDTRWVTLSDASPKTVAWDEWLKRAQRALRENDDAWFVDRSRDLTAPKDDSHFQGALTVYLEQNPHQV
jgi:hypothetical protein